MESTEFIFAQSKDELEINSLLRQNDLPSEDIDGFLKNFILARNKNKIIGVVGLEAYGEEGLLRSLVVDNNCRGVGIGTSLYEKIVAHASLLGIKKIYILTTTAEEFFSPIGFEFLERSLLPDSIKNSREFKEFCPSTAICMVKSIEKEAQYYPREVLLMRPDIEGAKMWGVSLKKTMMTCFEAEPNCRFEIHSHESEQITHVLEGEIFFEIDSKVVRVKKGEVIAIPSNIPHAAFTGDKGAKAVDAWSPIMEKYKGEVK